jgi:glucuronate isomerase
MLGEMPRMSCDDGLVMTLHPGVRRDHHGPTAERFGRDVGGDIPIRVEFTEALRPVLERLGTHPNLHLVVFTVDETVWSRELAPLAGFYPSVYVGVPWWFLDAPEAIRRFRADVMETAGFSRTSGFVDDTRAFCSIPARHDLSRRIDAGILANLVAEHRLEEDEATEPAEESVQTVSDTDLSRTAVQARPVCATSTLDSATSSGPTKPGTPTALPTPKTGESPRSPGATRSFPSSSAHRSVSTHW